MRFYLTNGAEIRLLERRYRDVEKEEKISQASIERAVINLCVAKNKSLLELTDEDYKSDKFGKTKQTASEIGKSIYNEILIPFRK